jgi:hypothetical protein
VKIVWLGIPLALAACDAQSSSPAPNPATATASVGGPAGSATPAGPASSSSPAPSTASTEESPDTWLIASKGGVELAVIELRAQKPPRLTLAIESADSAALKTKLDAVGGAEGIPLDMHLPPPSGQGRGAYGTRIVKYDDPLYRHALKYALEPAFDVKQVTRLSDPLPPPRLKQLQISRSGEKVGTVDFTSMPPKVTLHTAKSDGDSLKRHVEQVQTLSALKVRYQHPRDAIETLVVAEAKPGNANYAQTVVLHLMVEQYYLGRYGYRLEFTE